MDQLTEGCRQEELKLNIIQSRDIRLRPKLNKLCSEEIAIFCKDVKPGALMLNFGCNSTLGWTIRGSGFRVQYLR